MSNYCKLIYKRRFLEKQIWPAKTKWTYAHCKAGKIIF